MKTRHRFSPCIIVCTCVISGLLHAIVAAETPATFAEAKSVRIALGERASGPEAKAAELLQRRLLKRSQLQVVPSGAADVILVLGTVSSNDTFEKTVPG